MQPRIKMEAPLLFFELSHAQHARTDGQSISNCYFSFCPGGQKAHLSLSSICDLALINMPRKKSNKRVMKEAAARGRGWPNQSSFSSSSHPRSPSSASASIHHENRYIRNKLLILLNWQWCMSSCEKFPCVWTCAQLTHCISVLYV